MNMVHGNGETQSALDHHRKMYIFVSGYSNTTRETPAFGGISFALRENGAFGTHLAPPSAAVKVKK